METQTFHHEMKLKYFTMKFFFMETQTFHHEKKLKYFTMKKCNLQKKKKKSSKRNQSPSRYYYNNSIIITNLKFQHKSQNISSFKNPHIRVDLLNYYYLVGAKIP
jgi:hypothetical protein